MEDGRHSTTEGGRFCAVVVQSDPSDWTRKEVRGRRAGLNDSEKVKPK